MSGDSGERSIEIYLGSGLGLFAVKACIVAVVIAVCAAVVANFIVDTVEDSAARTIANVQAQWMQTPIGGRQFWTKLERELDRAADPKSDLSPEEKEKLLEDARVIAARWRSFFDSLQGETPKSINGNE